jgi:hypothetical protein
VRAAVEALTAAHPDWVAAQICVADWARRYGTPMTSWRPPASQAKQDELAIAYARDGYALLAPDDDGPPPGHARIASPYDTDARWGVKREEFWLGYKLHVTETCDDEPRCGCPGATDGGTGRRGHDETCAAPAFPNLITHVATTDATVTDNQLPRPIDDDTQTVTCPQSKTSASWTPCAQRGNAAIVATFSAADCGPCPVRGLCTTSGKNRRQLTVLPRDLAEAQAAEKQVSFQAGYARRAGVEGTMHQAASHGARRARYRGLPKPASTTSTWRARSTSCGSRPTGLAPR